MISIIICSRGKDIPQNQKDNLESTIGFPHEFVIIDNSDNRYNIFTAYNEGVARAQGEILCFLHDDVLMHTPGWGEIIARQLADPTIGLIGIAGSHYMSSYPLYWWNMPFTSQYNLTNDHGQQKLDSHGHYYHDDLADVAVVDGVCIFALREFFEQIRFDDTSYNGFHAYDMDISLQALACGKRVCATRAILIEHFWSEQSFENKKYMAMLNRNIKLFSDKWSSHLPVMRGLDMNQDEIDNLDQLCGQAYDAQCARSSKPYRLGRLLLLPVKKIKGLFAR